MASYSERTHTYRRKEFFLPHDSTIGELKKMIGAAQNQYSKGYDTDWFITSTDDEIVLYREEKVPSMPTLPDYPEGVR